MKTLRSEVGLILCAAGLVLTGITWADNTHRDFTSTNGCTIKGRLLDFDIKNRIATILRAGRVKPCHAPIDLFCDSDQQYIQTWAFEREFRDSLHISVTLVEVEGNIEVKDKRYDPQFIMCQAYELKLKNTSDTPFVEAEIQYAIFYEQTERRGSTRNKEEGVLCSRIGIGTITRGTQPDLTTKSVLIYDEGQGQDTSLFGSNGSAVGEIAGIWVRLTATLPSGERVTRDYCFPDDLMNDREWTMTTLVAGLNRNPDHSIALNTKLAPVKLPPVFRLKLD